MRQTQWVLTRPRLHNDIVGTVERAIRDRVAVTLAEIEHLDIRPMFNGFGFYVDGLLVAAAWENAFRLRHREHGRWIYEPVEEALLADPHLLVPMVRRRVEALSALPEARPRRPRSGDPRPR
jgi:hypothetical protein